MQSPAEFLSYAGYSAGWRTLRWMPERAAYRTFSGLADQLWRAHGKGVKQLERNLARVTGSTNQRTLRALSREGMQSYFRYWCDVFRLPDWSRQRLVDTFVMENNHRLQQVLDAGTGAVVALPHAGNWDRAGAYMTVAMTPIVSVAENLSPERLTTKFLDFRRELGMDIIVFRKGEDVFGDLVTKIGQGKIVALLGDRDLTSRGVGVDFFGEPTRMPAGPAALAIETGCPLMTADLWVDGPIATARISEALPVAREGDRNARVRATTQTMAERFAQGIAEHPTDWHMLQPLWLADLDSSRLQASRYDTPGD